MASKNGHKPISTNKSSIEIYRSEDGQVNLDVRFQGETVWLTQEQMAELFQTDRTSVLRHINNIYKSGELKSDATCANFAQVREEGNRQVTRHILFYNLDMVISVGYRVNSIRGTQSLGVQRITCGETFRITYQNAKQAISSLKGKYGGSAIFANEKDNSFRSSVG